MYVNDKDIMKINRRLKFLKKENDELNDQLKNYIPRRRVRRVFKCLKRVLEEDIDNKGKVYLNRLKLFIQEIEKNGAQLAGNDIKTAIEWLIGDYELHDDTNE
jgi:hypothetical protein